ncbi:MAG: AMP-binding protein [Bacilli bacterium]|nr:AMP-binding protein [Bacilli bacterium]
MGILDMNFFHFIGIKKKPKAPWKKFYQKKHMNIIVPNKNIYEYFYDHAQSYLDNTAIEYFGTKISYKKFLEDIDNASKCFKSLGVRKGDIVSIISANVPEALISFYALNKIGAICNMLHPLLSENEIKDILSKYSTAVVVALDITYSKLKNIISDTEVYKTIIISAKDSMGFLMRLGYDVTQGYKVEKPYNDNNYIFWKDFIKLSEGFEIKEKIVTGKDFPAAILQSGGSTGKPKGIVLSNGNFNSATIQAKIALADLDSDDVILGIMPIFHGFGLEVSINDAFCVGAKVVLIPTFKASEFHKLLIKYKPSVLVGVPTLFEAMTNNSKMEGVKLNRLKYVIAGGDSFNKAKVNKINDFLHSHGAKTNFTQGFGMTEAVAAVSFDLKYASRPGSVGIPWPGTYVKIVKPATDEEVPYGTDGEICISGPTVMLGYYNDEKETNDALHIHKDGNIWLHSGDIGVMDKDGFITYKQRLKRMIISSGYNVYPSQIEEVLEKHPAVLDSSVIGVPHPYKVEVAKAYIVLKKGFHDNEKLRSELKDLCEKNLAKYSIPKEWEFRKSLPKTIVGKVDFKKLQEENMRIRENEK